MNAYKTDSRHLVSFIPGRNQEFYAHSLLNTLRIHSCTNPMRCQLSMILCRRPVFQWQSLSGGFLVA